ncbi:MAG TPA: hypothetical protein EYO96_00090 [Candidatus Marinimicrobia bacterium]|nr:hypothetical protein [Candidatus Neomarinimicrobiota bacterium]
MKMGDMVKMKQGYSASGVVLSMPKAFRIISPTKDPILWVRVLWADHGPGAEKVRDLEVIQSADC